MVRHRRPGPPKLPWWKKILLAGLTTVGFFVVLEGVLALAGVEPRSFESDPYVGFAGTSRLFVEAASEDGTPVWRTARDKWSLFNVQEFARPKPPRVTRVFCVGGSTTYGRPYDDTTSFCGWLRELLAEAAPAQSFEVVNAGGVSYASYRVASLMEELADYEPDVFIIYTGHNEFLERRTYEGLIEMPEAVRGVGALAARTRTWTVVENAVDTVRPGRSAAPVEAPELASEVQSLLDQSVGLEAYERDDAFRDQVLAHLRFNLARMVDIARSAGATPVLVVPASNLRSCTPFKSEPTPGMGDAAQAEWEQRLREATRHYHEGEIAAAVADLTRAVELNPRHAHTLYLWAQALDAAGRVEDAAAAYRRARDEDVCPLRALSPVAEIVRAVAGDREVPAVDFQQLTAARAEDGIPGEDLFLDHVHPTVDGHRLVATALLETLADAQVAELDPKWGEADVERVAARIEATLDPEDHGLALMKLSKVLGWAGKLGESDRLARRAAELYPDSSLTQYQAGLTAELSGRLQEALARYARAVELQPDADLPHFNLAALLERMGRLEEAVSHYRATVAHATRDTAAAAPVALARALTSLSVVRYRADLVEEAVALLEEARQLQPENPEVLGRLGVARLRAGDAAGAAEAFARARTAGENTAVLANRHAVALAAAGRTDAAADAWRDAVALDARIASAPDAAPKVLERHGETAAAAALQAAASTTP